MKKIICCSGILFLAITSCSRKDVVIRTFTAGLPIVLTNSPATAIAGQDIHSSIRCELTSLSGSVNFKTFDIHEKAPHQFDISALAEYKDWNSQIGLDVITIFDTVATVKTTTPGTYILNFYNPPNLFGSDTVQVN